MGLFTLILSLICLTTLTYARKPANAVLLSDIKSLTFHAGKLTTARRVDPIPQLNPVGGSASTLYTPESIRCTNSGSSYSTSDIEWTCTASLPPEFKLGSTDVVCEGYENADDDYILKGSCGVEYRLVLTEAGEKRYGKGAGGRSTRESGGRGGDGEGDGTAWVFWMVFIGVVLWMAYSYFKNRATGNTPGGRGTGYGGYGGGGGGGDDNNDPPPPYDAYAPKQSPSSSSYANRAPRTNTASRAPRQQQQQQGWRPGFWTGAAAGAAGGYLAGNRGATQQVPQMQQQARPAPSSDVGPSYSQERYTSTGFGSTRRR